MFICSSFCSHVSKEEKRKKLVNFYRRKQTERRRVPSRRKDTERGRQIPAGEKEQKDSSRSRNIKVKQRWKSLSGVEMNLTIEFSCAPAPWVQPSGTWRAHENGSTTPINTFTQLGGLFLSLVWKLQAWEEKLKTINRNYLCHLIQYRFYCI